MKTRVVTPELLDELAPGQPQAIDSRRDLKKINRIMGNALICERAITDAMGGAPPQSIVELGCGDGAFLSSVAARKAREWPAVEIWLVDRLPVATGSALRDFANAGWTANPVTGDVTEWLPRAPVADVYLANLFLHHFQNPALGRILRLAADKCRVFVACEPRRGWLGLLASGSLGLIGCNSVTRHDAVASVRAGFLGGELSALWEPKHDWQLAERETGAFSHLFVARRRAATKGTAS